VKENTMTSWRKPSYEVVEAAMEITCYWFRK
jgi:hypothetical protein